ncbi:unnamed protein product [Rotaria sp. Silwood1]|nr:unnamed protein product [Rotaria sp. Silwood1]
MDAAQFIFLIKLYDNNAIRGHLPLLLFYTIIEVRTGTGKITHTCSIINSGLLIYVSYIYRPVILSILPGTILAIFGWLTYCNVTKLHSTQRRCSFQRGLTSMVLLQTIVVMIPIIPFAIINIYQVVTSSIVKSDYRLSQEQLVYTVANIILYVSYASNFYVYLISASSYRKDFRRLVLFCYRQNHASNRIGIMAREQVVMKTNSTVK